MTEWLETLKKDLKKTLGDAITFPETNGNELTVECLPDDLLDVSAKLRDDPLLRFEQLTDLSGIDYSEFHNWEGPRYAVVIHLLSFYFNRRLRLRVFCQSRSAPVIPSVSRIWSSSDWYEREAFDLLGIHFDGHSDLRRILTDYGFTGHPLRKDFPVSGNVEAIYDPQLKRVVYQPVTIEPREITPRIVREDKFGDRHG